MGKAIRNKKLKVTSLFCGCGGMDLGIQGYFNFLGKHFVRFLYGLQSNQQVVPGACFVYLDYS